MVFSIIQPIRNIRFWYLVNIKWRRFSFGRNPYFGRAVNMWAKHTIVTGDNFFIGKYSLIECDAELGDNVMMASKVALIGRYDHNYMQTGVPMRLASRIMDKDYNWKGLSEIIVISDDVWIGYGSIILSGVKIGEGSIVAAGSVVTKDVEPYSIYAGVPAKKLRNRFDSEEQKEEHIRLYRLNYKKT